VADTIREFLVGLGFSVNESQQRNFVGALEGATLRANLLATAIEDMARTVVDKVGEVATQFEQLFYQSSRVGASASSIRAFEYAVSQLGGTIEGANSSLEDFAKFLRESPGSTAAIANLLKIPLADAKDSAKFLLEANEALSRLSPALQAKYRETFHLGDYNTSHALQNPAAPGLYGGQLDRDAASGIGGDAMKRAAEFEQAWRGVWARIGTMAEGGESKLLAALTEPMQKFGDWLDKNSPQINDAISKMATAVGSLTTAWVDDLSKVKWPEVAKDFDEIAKSIAHFTDELVRSLPLLQAFLGALVGARVGGVFGPLGALVGAGAGALAPGMIEQEMDPNAPHAADTGVGGVLSRAWGGVKRFFGGGGGNKGVGGWWTPERMKYAADRLVSESGLSQVGAAGLVARWAAVEAPGGPTSSNNIGGGHWGIGQWSTARGGPAIGAASFEDQVSHAIGELKTTEARAAAQLRSAKTEGEAAVGASMFERAENYNPVSGVDDQTANTPVGKVLKALGSGAPPSGDGPQMSSAGGPWVKSGGKEYATDQNGRIVEGVSRSLAIPPATKPLNWDTGPVWDRFNAQLPTGPSGGSDSSKSITSSVTNNITVSGSDPQSTAAMVGVHLDRTSNDISRNLQGAFQ
jgi:hypothetical protein